MQSMTNIFDYATKELSQDGFLLWLYSNWDCKEPNLRAVSRDFIKFTTGISEKESIVLVELFKQWNRIDIRVDITTQNEEVSLFIEDKTTSEEHNQLEKYNDVIKRIDRRPIKLFYKTHDILNDEADRVSGSGWEIMSFDEIKSFWGKYKENQNLIVSQYAKHVCKVWEDCHNTNKPKDNNVDAWYSYFAKVVIPRLHNCDAIVERARYGYAYLKIKPLGLKKQNMPYLEVRGRDCIEDRFRALILMYDVDFINHPEGVAEIREVVRSREGNHVFICKNGEVRNKQVANTSELTGVVNDEMFIDELQRSIDEYLQIISFW